MMLPKRKPLRSRKYLNSFKDASCMVCMSTESTVGCHIRSGFFGIGIKPDDSLTVALCYTHHMEQHKIGETAFFRRHFEWSIDDAKDAARQRYESWANE